MMLSDLEAALGRVPDYRRFLTVDEMLERTRAVAVRNPDLVTHSVIGESTDGEPIPMVKIGDGEQRLLLVGCPHPNEPIGAMLIQFLLEELIENPELRRGRTWYLVPCADLDGTRLNEGWFAGPYTVRNYARHFYRPYSTEQVEWTFPFSYKEFKFDAPIPETRALMRAFKEIEPAFVYSLHNAGFGGVYYYLSHDVPDAYLQLHALPQSRDLFLSLGEPEAPWAVEFHPAVFQSLGIAEAYDYYEKYSDTRPSELIQGGGSSLDYLKSVGLTDTLMLVTELPYFQAKQISDLSPLPMTRGEAIIEGIERSSQISKVLLDIIEKVDPHITLDTRFYQAVTSFAGHYGKGEESKRRWAETAEGMDQPATVAQHADEVYVGTFYRLLIASMLRRAIDAQLAEGVNQPLQSARQELEEHLDRWAEHVERNLEYSAIPIRSLVQVQYGAMLAVLASVRTGSGDREKLRSSEGVASTVD